MLDLTEWTNFDIERKQWKYISNNIVDIELLLTNKNGATFLINRTLNISDINTEEKLSIWIISQLNQNAGIYFEDKQKLDKKLKVGCTLNGSLSFSSVT